MLGRYVRYEGYEAGSGEIANILMDDFANFSDNWFSHDQSEGNQAVSLLLAASALRPALLAPNTDASRILHSVRLGEGLNQLYEYCQIIANYGDKRLTLDPKVIKTVKSQKEWNAEVTLLSQKVDNWWSQALRLSLRTQAGKIWKNWLEPDGLIYELISPLKKIQVSLEEDFAHIEAIKHKIEKFNNPNQIDREIDLTKESLPANKKRNLDKDDISKLHRYVNQALDFCRIWVDLQELRLDKSNALTQRQARQAEQLKQDLSILHNAVLEELDTFKSKNSSVLLSTGIFYCQFAVTDIWNLFAPDISWLTVEPDPRHILNADLLKIPYLPLNEDWQPKNSNPNLLMKGILELINQNDFGWQQAFDARSNCRDHHATEKIIEYLHANSEDTIAILELDRLRDERIAECRDSLKRDLKETKNQIENAVALGILQEAERANYAAMIVEIETRAGISIQFYQEHEELESIKTAISQKKQDAIENVRQRLNSLLLAANNSNYVRIIELLEKGDVLTANEYIDMVERKDTIPETELEQNILGEFFPDKVLEIDKFMEEESRNPLIVIQKVEKRENFCGINLKRLSGSATDRAAEMLQAWFNTKRVEKSRKPTISEKDAKTILTNLGFNPLQIVVSQSGGRTWINISTEEIKNKELCPVAAYGSAVHGQYRILCVWDRPTVEDILNAIGETSHGSPALVFFFGRLTEQRRRELAWICRERTRTFILIDDILMLYLCGAEEPRLPTLFKCALPFTILKPYAETAGLVPPEIFYGRKQERDSIIDPMGSCFIYGGRQLGKTALLRAVEREFHAPQEGRIGYWLDLKACGIGINRSIEDIWSLLADEFKVLEVLPRNISTNVGAETLLRHLQTWLEEDKSRRILLLLDEADKFLESDGTRSRQNNKVEGEFIQTSRLKGLMDRTNRRFKVVFAGLHNVQRTTRLENHPLAHYGKPICIGPLLDNGEWREARNLVKRPLASIGYELSDDLVTRILSQTNYYPSLIQLYCKELLEDVNENHLIKFNLKNTPPYHITDRQVDEAYQSQDLRKAIRDRFMWTLQLDRAVRSHCLLYHL